MSLIMSVLYSSVLMYYNGKPLGLSAKRATTDAFGIVFNTFFSADTMIKFSKRFEAIELLTADLIKSTLLWLRSQEDEVTGKVKRNMSRS